MSVYIACEQCQKRLKIPEEILGRSIECPSCGTVFKSNPSMVVTSKPAAPPPVATDEDEEDVVAMRKKVAAVEDDEDMPKPRKKAAVLDDDDTVTVKKKPAARDGDDEDEEEDRPARAKKRRPADEDEDDEDEEEEGSTERKRTPWYLLLPLVILSLLGIGIAFLWVLGFVWLKNAGYDFINIDQEKNIAWDTKMWIGIPVAAVVTLLCLVFSLIQMRAWLRFLLVFLLLLLGYGGSFAVVHWWRDLPF
jgi:hypothetical protein